MGRFCIVLVMYLQIITCVTDTQSSRGHNEKSSQETKIAYKRNELGAIEKNKYYFAIFQRFRDSFDGTRLPHRNCVNVLEQIRFLNKIHRNTSSCRSHRRGKQKLEIDTAKRDRIKACGLVNACNAVWGTHRWTVCGCCGL